MSGGTPSLIDRLRRREYTGANRCTPCTVANCLIALILSVLVAVATSLGVGVAVLVVCGLMIYLRGYLIPGTPTLTKRYLPARVHRLFGTHHAGPRKDGEIMAADGAAERHDVEGRYGSPEKALRAEGVIKECPDADDLCLHPKFREAWRNRIVSLRERGSDAERLAAHLDVDPEAVSLEDHGEEYAVTFHGDRVDGWPSRAAFLADMGVEPTLTEWCSDWQSYDPELRTRIIASLRAFLERCPACGLDLETSESTWETCCRVGTDVTLACDVCGEVVFSGRY